MELPPLHPALRSSVRSGRRRRRLHHGLGADRRHDAPLERERFPLRHGAGRSRRRREDRALAGHQAHLWRELDRAPGLCAAGRFGRRLFPPRPAVGLAPISTRSASTSIGRCRIGATARTTSTSSQAAPSTTSTICAAMSAAARPSTSTIPPPARPATRRARSASRRPARRSPTAPTASLGCTSRRRSRSGGRTSTSTGLAASSRASPTAWVPQSKPIWFTELGCPAVDKGSNQPNVFIDPKSSESFAPFFSRVTRDDLMQRRYIQALSSFFDPDDPDYVAGSNPTSSEYDAADGRCVAALCLHLGRAALSCLPARALGVGRRRQLGARPLAHRPRRRRRRRRGGGAAPRRLRLHPLRRERACRLARRLRRSTG